MGGPETQESVGFGTIFRRGSGALCLSTALLLGACGGSNPPPPTPEATITAFSRALADRRYGDAYRMMSSDYRNRVSLETFEAELSSNPQETLEMSNDLGRVRGPAVQEAVLRYSETGELRLEQHGDRWFIATDVVEFYDQSTPRAALRSFVRAMERQRYDIVLRLVPTPDKEGLTTERMKESWSGEGREEVERMLSNLRNHLDNPIEILGNHATMPYGDRMRVQFLREGESWKIEDPE